jgi:hypothetical protein
VLTVLDTLILRGELRPRPPADFGGRSPRTVMKDLLAADTTVILLTGELVDAVSPAGIALPVEEDALILLEMYDYFESVASQARPYEFDAFLGEGQLVITTVSDSRQVTVTLTYQLENGSGRVERVVPDENLYLGWWRGIAAAMLGVSS